MSDRRRSMARVVALQAKVKAIAASRLAGAEAAKAAVVADRDALQRFVDGADLFGAMALLAGAQMRSLTAREAEAEQRRLTLAHARQQAETRLKLAERVHDTLAKDERAAAERQALERLMEEALARVPPEATD